MSPYSNVATVVTPGPILLSGVGTKVKGKHVVELDWQGAQSSHVEIHRAGAPDRIVPNTGSFTDETGEKGKQTYEFWLCEEFNSGQCSNSILVRF
jgi:hypothetical protein